MKKTHAADKQTLSNAIAAEKTRAEGVESGHETRIAAMETFFKFTNEAEKNAAYDTLKELQDYIEGDASAAAQMAQNIQTNANDIDALEGRMTTAEGNITTLTTNLNTEITNREGAVTGAINTAKAYTDDALEWGTF